MRKGIALAMETIVYIILAVLVLAVLLYFLTSQAAPVQNQAQLRQQVAEQCSALVQLDRECKPESFPILGSKITDLQTACEKLNTAECGAIGGSQPNCIKRCCQVYGCPAPA